MNIAFSLTSINLHKMNELNFTLKKRVTKIKNIMLKNGLVAASSTVKFM